MSFTEGHALLIGVGTHQDKSILDVPITVTDANAVDLVLRDPTHCGYPDRQVKVLHKEGATKAGILAALDDLAHQVKETDTVFFFYCGHGALGTDGNYYLVSHDARLRGNRIVAGSGVSEGELLARLKAIRAERLLMVLNACHSGHMSGTLEPTAATLPTLNPTAETAAALLGTGKGRIIMVACGEQQYSYIGDGALTIFTQALVDGLRGSGVPNQHGYIGAFSLYEQIYAVVSAAVKDQFGETQAPELTVLKGIGPFAVSLYKGASPSDGFAANQPLPEGLAVHTVEQAESEKLFNQRVLQTGGGAAVGRDVDTAGGDFTGRDQTIQGDKTAGDKFGGDKVRGNKVGGVSIGNVTGGIHGSTIAGRDVKGNVSHTEQRGGINFGSGNTIHSTGSMVAGNQVSGAPANEATSATYSLDEIYGRLTRIQRQSQPQDPELAEDLGVVLICLDAAITAREANKTTRYQDKMDEAKEGLSKLARSHWVLREIAAMLA